MGGVAVMVNDQRASSVNFSQFSLHKKCSLEINKKRKKYAKHKRIKTPAFQSDKLFHPGRNL
jgi:hypothetical protein